MTIILFLVVLAVLIFVHELGHFLMAKRAGIRVDEFAIGFPPKIFSWTRGETKYSLNLIPFGGFVKIFGENPDEESLTGPDSGRSYARASRFKQALILLSGVGMNVIFAWILISVSFMFGSTVSLGDGSRYDQTAVNPRVIITSVLPDSPAAQAGLRMGNEIEVVSLANSVEPQDLTGETIDHIQTTIKSSQGDPVRFYLKGEDETKVITPAKGIAGQDYAVGITMATVGEVKFNPLLALWVGAKETFSAFKEVSVGLYNFIGQSIRGQANLSQITGPVGLVGLVGDAAHFGLTYFLGFVAFISLNLAVINLIPFPALDGGRLLFVIIESLIRRPIKPVIVNLLNTIGFAILIGLMLFITYKDIMKFF